MANKSRITHHVSRFTLADINRMDRRTFTGRLGHLFEGSPWIAERAWDGRPFGSLQALQDALCSVMYGATVDEKLALIRAHPDLVGRAALACTLAPESAGEQASAGLDRLTPEEVETFNRLNAAYRERFGFPFVICARENKKESILAGFNARLQNTRDQEIETALREIAKIAGLRLADITSDHT
jgi:OHCU decarboxylase